MSGPEFPFRLGELIRAYRKHVGWSQQELANRSRVEQAHIARIEGGTYLRPQEDTLERLAKGLAEGLPDTTWRQIADNFIMARNNRPLEREIHPLAVLADDKLQVYPKVVQSAIWRAILALIDALPDVFKAGR